LIAPEGSRNSSTGITPSDLYPMSTMTSFSRILRIRPRTTSPSARVFRLAYWSSSFSYSDWDISGAASSASRITALGAAGSAAAAGGVAISELRGASLLTSIRWKPPDPSRAGLTGPEHSGRPATRGGPWQGPLQALGLGSKP